MIIIENFMALNINYTQQLKLLPAVDQSYGTYNGNPHLISDEEE